MIIICDKCKGTGHLCWDEGTHKSEYKYGECHECKGSGRIVQEITETEEPFVPDENDANQATRIH